MERSRNAWVPPSWAKLQGCGPKRLKLFNIVSSMATHCSAHSRCSTNVYETSVRIASRVYDKIWNGSRTGEFTFTKRQLCVSLLTCIVSYLCDSAPFYTEKKWGSESSSHSSKVTPPPTRQGCKMKLNSHLISSTLSPVLVLTPFCDPTHVSWPPWACRSSKKTSFSLVLDLFLGWSSIPLTCFPILSCAKKNSPRFPPTLCLLLFQWERAWWKVLAGPLVQIGICQCQVGCPSPFLFFASSPSFPLALEWWFQGAFKPLHNLVLVWPPSLP